MDGQLKIVYYNYRASKASEILLVVDYAKCYMYIYIWIVYISGICYRAK